MESITRIADALEQKKNEDFTNDSLLKDIKIGLNDLTAHIATLSCKLDALTKED